MDAKDRLRRYLEQRRELGESELVLDSLSVEDVLQMVGVKSTAPNRTSAAAPSAAKPRGQAAADRAADPPLPVDPHSVPVTPVAPPPEPGVRFAPGATTDWREALRNAGATRPNEALSPPVAPTSSPTVGVGALGKTPLAAPVAPATVETPVQDVPAWLSALGLPHGIEAGRLRVVDAAPELAAASRPLAMPPNGPQEMSTTAPPPPKLILSSSTGAPPSPSVCRNWHASP